MIIPGNIIEALFEQAGRKAPVEACGYLAGIDGRVSKHYPMTNIEGRNDHFAFDPKEQFAVHKSSRDEGLTVIGVYHSHPASPARPSREDIRLAYDPTVVYIIVSLMDGIKMMRGFRIIKGQVEEEPMIIEENCHER
jgi:proteasome lid subunit RPN8/RPN11